MEETSTNLFSLFQNLGESAIYLMGFSFILGALFTMFLLVILELVRRNNPQPPEEG